MLRAIELERARVARDLHDVVGQLLTTLRLDLESATRAASVDRDRLTVWTGLVDGALAQVRSMAAELRPTILDDVGLVGAIQATLLRLTGTIGIEATLRADPGLVRFPLEVETAAFRVATEAITNSVRHAQATAIAINIRATRNVLDVLVRDDGRGFEAPPDLPRHDGRGLGLLGMFERVRLVGGSLRIDSRPGRGTVIHARFPRHVAV